MLISSTRWRPTNGRLCLSAKEDETESLHMRAILVRWAQSSPKAVLIQMAGPTCSTTNKFLTISRKDQHFREQTQHSSLGMDVLESSMNVLFPIVISYVNKDCSEALILCTALRSWSHCGCSVTLLGQKPVWCFRKYGSMYVQLHDRFINCYDKRRKSYWVHSKRWEKFSCAHPFQVAKFHSSEIIFANMDFWIFIL
jgi:hypothetical protein